MFNGHQSSSKDNLSHQTFCYKSFFENCDHIFFEEALSGQNEHTDLSNAGVNSRRPSWLPAHTFGTLSFNSIQHQVLAILHPWNFL